MFKKASIVKNRNINPVSEGVRRFVYKGKSKNDITDFNFSSGASSRVICTDWSNEMNLEDEFRVILSSKEWTYFITNVAYK